MTVRQKVDQTDLQPPLPSTATTLEGIEFHPNDDVWPVGGLTRSERMKFGIFDRLSRRMVHRLKWALTISLQNKSFSHSSNLHNQFFLFYRVVLRGSDTVHDRIELSHILSF